MYERDQGMRTRMREAGPPREREFDAELARTDRQITRELRKVVSRFGWSGHRNSGFIRELQQLRQEFLLPDMIGRMDQQISGCLHA